MHFNAMPEDVHHLIFKKTNLQHRIVSLSLVCRHWNTIARATLASQHHLFLFVDSRPKREQRADIRYICRNYRNIVPIDIIQFTGLSHHIVENLADALPNVTSLSIWQAQQPLNVIQEAAYLVNHWSAQLTHLGYSFQLSDFKEEEEDTIEKGNPFTSLIATINQLPRLRVLGFNNETIINNISPQHDWSLNFEWPIFAQLDSLEISQRQARSSKNLIHSLHHYAGANERLKAIRFYNNISAHDDMEDMLNLPPRVASKFNTFVTLMDLDLAQLEMLCDRFCSLTHLYTVIPIDMSFSQFIACLSSLEKLNMLYLLDPVLAEHDEHPIEELKRLRSVTHFSFSLFGKIDCKNQLKHLHLDWIFPRLKDIVVYPNPYAEHWFECVDCHSDCLTQHTRQQKIECARRLFAPITHMSSVKIKYFNILKRGSSPGTTYLTHKDIFRKSLSTRVINFCFLVQLDKALITIAEQILSDSLKMIHSFIRI